MLSDTTYLKAADPQRRTKPVSFRLSETLINELKKEASMNQEDLSSLGKDILTRYIDWGRHSRRLNLVPVSREFLKDLFEYLSEDTIRKIASKAGRNTLVELTLLAQGTMTLESFSSMLTKWLKACGMTVSFERNGEYRFVISHSQGRKWSSFLAQTISAISEELPMKVKVRSEIRNETLVVELKPTVADAGSFQVGPAANGKTSFPF